MKPILSAVGLLLGLGAVLWLLAGHSESDPTPNPQTAPGPAATSAPSPSPPPVATPVPAPAALDPNNIASAYHSIDSSAMACNEPKVTAEMQDASDHPGTLSDDAFGQLWNEGQCSPIVPGVNFTVTRLFEFQVAAGLVKMAEATMRLSDGSENKFFILQNRIVASQK